MLPTLLLIGKAQGHGVENLALVIQPQETIQHRLVAKPGHGILARMENSSAYTLEIRGEDGSLLASPNPKSYYGLGGVLLASETERKVILSVTNPYQEPQAVTILVSNRPIHRAALGKSQKFPEGDLVSYDLAVGKSYVFRQGSSFLEPPGDLYGPAGATATDHYQSHLSVFTATQTGPHYKVAGREPRVVEEVQATHYPDPKAPRTFRVGPAGVLYFTYKFPLDRLRAIRYTAINSKELPTIDVDYAYWGRSSISLYMLDRKPNTRAVIETRPYIFPLRHLVQAKPGTIIRHDAFDPSKEWTQPTEDHHLPIGGEQWWRFLGQGGSLYKVEATSIAFAFSFYGNHKPNLKYRILARHGIPNYLLVSSISGGGPYRLQRTQISPLILQVGKTLNSNDIHDVGTPVTLLGKPNQTITLIPGKAIHSLFRGPNLDQFIPKMPTELKLNSEGKLSLRIVGKSPWTLRADPTLPSGAGRS